MPQNSRDTKITTCFMWKGKRLEKKQKARWLHNNSGPDWGRDRGISVTSHLCWQYWPKALCWAIEWPNQISNLRFTMELRPKYGRVMWFCMKVDSDDTHGGKTRQDSLFRLSTLQKYLSKPWIWTLTLWDNLSCVISCYLSTMNRFYS